MAPSTRLKIAVAALVVVCAGVAVAVLSGGGPGSDRLRRVTVAPSRARSADAFVESIGVNTHFNYLDTSYGRQVVVLARLKELGVKQIRDAVPLGAPALATALRTAASFGVRLTLLAGDVRVQPLPAVSASQRVAGRAVFAYEGPNEIDNGHVPGWPTRLRAQMAALRAAVRSRARGVPVVGPSFVHPQVYGSVDRTTFDAANLHPYAGGLAPEEPQRQALDGLRRLGVTAPVVFTEVGYHNATAASAGQPPVSEAAAAVYLPRALLASFGAGVARTFVYELADQKPDPGLRDPERHFGLLRFDLSPKPAFLAVRNLIAAVRASPGPASAGVAPPVVRGPAGLLRLDMRRSDGSRVVALWRAASVWDRDGRHAVDPGVVAVDVSWGARRPARDLVVTRPTVSGAPVLRRPSAARVRLSLGGDAVLLSYR